MARWVEIQTQLSRVWNPLAMHSYPPLSSPNPSQACFHYLKKKEKKYCKGTNVVLRSPGKKRWDSVLNLPSLPSSEKAKNWTPGQLPTLRPDPILRLPRRVPFVSKTFLF